MASLCGRLLSVVELNDAVIVSIIRSGAVIIDARSKVNHENGHVHGAISVPAGDHSSSHIDANIMLVEGSLPEKDYPILVYDDLGSDSSFVIKALKRTGFHNITNAGGFQRLDSLMKRLQEEEIKDSREKQKQEALLQKDAEEKRRHLKLDKYLRLLPLNLILVRAIDRTPKECLERYAAQNSLMALPFLRKCDVGPFVDLLLDCCEEIECEPGTELTTQGLISDFVFIITRGEVLSVERKENGEIIETLLTEGSCFGSRCLCHLPEQSSTVVQTTPVIRSRFHKKNKGPEQVKSVRLYCLHQTVYRQIRCIDAYDETIRRRQLLASIECFRALRAQDLDRLCWSLKPETFRRNEVIFVSETSDSGLPTHHSGRPKGLDFGGDSSSDSDEELFVDKNDNLYIVQSGKIEVRVGPGRGHFIGKLLPGDVFGEGGLLSSRRPATRGCITMGGSCGASALILNRSDFELCFGVCFEDLTKERFLIQHLRRVPVLSTFSEKQCGVIARSMSRHFYSNGELIAEEHSEANEFILIMDGVAKLIASPPSKSSLSFNGQWSNTIDEKRQSSFSNNNSFAMQKTMKNWSTEPVVIGSLETWEYFGERSLVYKGELRKVGLVACGAVEALVLSRHDFQRLVHTQLADSFAWECVVEGEFSSVKETDAIIESKFSQMNFAKKSRKMKIDALDAASAVSSSVSLSSSLKFLSSPIGEKQFKPTSVLSTNNNKEEEKSINLAKKSNNEPKKTKDVKEKKKKSVPKDEDGNMFDKRRLNGLLRIPLKSVKLADLTIVKESSLSELSAGFSDDVFCATSLKTKYLMRYCQKQFIIESGGGPEFAHRIAIERRLLLGELRGCLGVVPCIGTFQTSSSVMLLYEFLGGGTLNSMLRTVLSLHAPSPLHSFKEEIVEKEEKEGEGGGGNENKNRSSEFSLSRKRNSTFNIGVCNNIPPGMVRDITASSEVKGGGHKQEACLKVSKTGGIDEKDARFYVASVILALKSIHGRGVAHRDVRLSNILIGSNGYPKLFGFTRGKRIPYRTGRSPAVPPPMAKHASKAHFADTTKVFDPLLIIAKQAHNKAMAFAKLNGNPLPPTPGPTRAAYQIDADTVGPKEAAAKLTIFHNDQQGDKERESARDEKANEVATSHVLSMAEKETLLEEEELKNAKAHDAPLLWKTYTMCGLVEYSAPEMLLGIGHDLAVDHWALGCLIHELLTGRTPFVDAPQDPLFSHLEVHERILSTLSGSMKTGELAIDVNRYFSPRLSPEAADLIAGLMRPQPEHRIGTRVRGWQEVMDHVWFSKYFEEEKLRSYLELDSIRYRFTGGFTHSECEEEGGVYRGHGRFVSWDALAHGEVKPPFVPTPQPNAPDAPPPVVDLSRFVVTHLQPGPDAPFLLDHRSAFNSF